jgi:hypothetical protein
VFAQLHSFALADVFLAWPITSNKFRPIKKLKARKEPIDKRCGAELKRCNAQFSQDVAQIRASANGAELHNAELVNQMSVPNACDDQYRRCFLEDSSYWNYEKRIAKLKRQLKWRS